MPAHAPDGTSLSISFCDADRRRVDAAEATLDIVLVRLRVRENWAPLSEDEALLLRGEVGGEVRGSPGSGATCEGSWSRSGKGVVGLSDAIVPRGGRLGEKVVVGDYCYSENVWTPLEDILFIYGSPRTWNYRIP